MLVFVAVRFEETETSGEPFSPGAQAAGWLLVTLCLVPIPVYAIYAFHKTQGETFKQVSFRLQSYGQVFVVAHRRIHRSLQHLCFSFKEVMHGGSIPIGYNQKQKGKIFGSNSRLLSPLKSQDNIASSTRT